jgi:Domain of unknown function (DUF4838)
MSRAGITLVNTSADPATGKAAEEVASVLGRITSNEVRVATSPGAGANIVLQLASTRPDLGAFALPPNALERDQVLLRSYPNTLQIVGRTERGLIQGLWTLASELGYRQYFANPAWEYVAPRSQVEILVDRTLSPRYQARSFSYGYTLASTRPTYDRWMTRNRVSGALEVRAEHSYGRISSFLVNGEPAGTTAISKYPDFFETPSTPTAEASIKFCTTNPRLQDKVRAYIDATMSVANPPSSISMEPSDGDGWGTCTCADCPRLTSTTDKAVTLANVAANYVAVKYPGTYIGISAYYTHSAPPNFPVLSNVLVNVTTSFRAPGMTVEDLLSGWQAKGATVGIRDYLSINASDRDLPTWPRASRFTYLKQLDSWASLGAHFYTTEASNNWGPAGLGYYVMSRSMWETVDAEKIRDEFLNAMFPESLSAMRPFYAYLYPPEDWTGTPPTLLKAHITQLYKYLSEAYGKTKDAAAITRLDLLGQYVRYVDLVFTLANGNYNLGRWSTPNLEAILQYTFRIRNTGMVHSYALHRDIPLRRTTPLPDSILMAPWYLKDQNVGTASVPAGMQDFTHDEILAWVQAGAQ